MLREWWSVQHFWPLQENSEAWGSHGGQCLGLLCWGLLHSLWVQACAWGGAGNLANL